MTTLMLIVFAVFLVVLIVLDIMMIVSLLKQGDERRQLIVWKASAFTLLVVVLTLILDIAESIAMAEAMQINPFIKLSITAMVYFISLVSLKKRYGG